MNVMSVFDQDGKSPVDFELPSVKLDKNHAEGSSTSVAWERDLLEKVIFEPRDDFNNLFLYLKGAMYWIPDEKWKDTRECLNVAVKYISPGHAIGDDGTASKPVYSTCTSMANIFGNIYGAVCCAVQEIAGTRRAIVKTRAVWLGAPGAHPMGLPEERKEAVSSETAGEDAQAEEGSEQRDVQERQEEQQEGAEEEEQDEQEEKSMEQDAQEEQGNPLADDGDSSDGSEEQEKKKRRHRIPDYTLMILRDLNDAVGAPTVAFEVKGPLLDILGTPVGEKSGRLPRRPVSAQDLCNRYNAIFRNKVAPGPAGSTPQESQGRRPTDSESEEEVAPIPLLMMPDICALRPVCQALSYALSVTSGCVLLDNFYVNVAMKVVKGPKDGLMRVKVSRAVFRKDAEEGMGTVEARLALCLYGIKRSVEEKDLPAYLESLTETFGKKDDADADGSKKQSRPGRRPGRGGKRRRASKREGFGSAKRRKTNARGNGETRENECFPSQTDPGMSTGSEESKCRPPLHEAETTNEDSLGIDRGPLREQTLIENGAAALDIADVDVSSECTLHAEGARLSLKEAEKLPVRKFLGQGSTGNVYLSEWNEKLVAVKKWNGVNGYGKAELENEVSIYSALLSMYPSILGVAVPNVLLAWKDSRGARGSKASLLITEFVGHELERDTKGTLRLVKPTGKFEVSGKEEMVIYKEAMKSLGLLHSNGYVHGDIALRNIRARKISGLSAERAWRVWWIDLGQAEKIRASLAPANFRAERRFCSFLFCTRV